MRGIIAIVAGILAVGSASALQADPITAGQQFRFDFDLSGLSPSGPYTRLDGDIFFGSDDIVDLGETASIEFFDADDNTLRSSPLVLFDGSISADSAEVFSDIASLGTSSAYALLSWTSGSALIDRLELAFCRRGALFFSCSESLTASGTLVGGDSGNDEPDEPPVTQVSEPGTLVLLGAGLLGMGVARKRKRSS